MTVIYALVDPRNREIRYVGKADNPKRRLRAHISRSIRSPGARKCASWVASLISSGVKPEMMELESIVGSWEEAEKYWIAYMRFVGANLVNMTTGGGKQNGHAISQSAREKISRAAKAQFSNPEARKAAAEYGRMAKRSEKMREIHSSTEFRKKQSEIKKRLYADPAYAEKMLQVRRNADHSGGAKRMWERPEYREAQRVARERRYGKKVA